MVGLIKKPSGKIKTDDFQLKLLIALLFGRKPKCFEGNEYLCSNLFFKIHIF